MTSDIWLIVLCGMFHFACHECVGIFLEDPQTGACAKVDRLTVVFRAGIICRVFESPTTGGFVFRQ